MFRLRWLPLAANGVGTWEEVGFERVLTLKTLALARQTGKGQYQSKMWGINILPACPLYYINPLGSMTCRQRRGTPCQASM